MQFDDLACVGYFESRWEPLFRCSFECLYEQARNWHPGDQSLCALRFKDLTGDMVISILKQLDWDVLRRHSPVILLEHLGYRKFDGEVGFAAAVLHNAPLYMWPASYLVFRTHFSLNRGGGKHDTEANCSDTPLTPIPGTNGNSNTNTKP